MEKIKVLVADDDTSIVEMLKCGLEALGYGVTTASSGSSIREVLKREAPDAIVMDVGMPGLDGISLCRELRNAPATVDTPIIIITAFSDEQTHHDAMLFGATDFVTKPFDIRDVQRKINDSVAKLKAKRGNQS